MLRCFFRCQRRAQPPAPVQSEERASPAPATAAAVATLHSPASPVRGITNTEIRFGIAAPFSGSAKELGRRYATPIFAISGRHLHRQGALGIKRIQFFPCLRAGNRNSC
jgi:hypothetical protein